ncbi:MAG: fibrobacter succinogenes major paralogous domain-containing protein [Prolixibacteraceae bacterium]|jgi:uncharacterized protein (TIGR02145 family)|nr:fibrobacter succinogenes major paralogous domain-containing protein [Prolixibacteraceae bacterium]
MKLFEKTFLPASLLLFIFSFLIFSCDDEGSEPIPCKYSIDVSEFEIIRINQENVIVFMEIDDDDLNDVEALGYVWSESADSVNLENADGAFVAETVVEDNIHQLDGLQPNTTYKVRAYVTTGIKTFFSNQLVFTTIDEDGVKGTVTDIDGNLYETMIIGGNEWMLENIRVTHYRDGSSIDGNIEDEKWSSLTTGAYGVYPYDKIDGFETEEEIMQAYGVLYNWYAVDDERGLAPEGWHVASDEEWRQLEMALGMSEADSKDTDMRGSDQGIQMKIEATYPAPHPRWDEGNVSTNSSGFSVVPGGARYPGRGNFGYKGFAANFWTATGVGTGDAWLRGFVYHNDKVGRFIDDKSYGFSVRCVKDNL